MLNFTNAPPQPRKMLLIRGIIQRPISVLISAASDQHPISSPHLSLRRQHSLDIERQLYRPIFCSAASAPGSRNSSLGGGGGSLAVSGGCVEGALKTPTSVSVPPEIRRGSGGATHFCQGVCISALGIFHNTLSLACLHHMNMFFRLA